MYSIEVMLNSQKKKLTFSPPAKHFAVERTTVENLMPSGLTSNWICTPFLSNKVWLEIIAASGLNLLIIYPASTTSAPQSRHNIKSATGHWSSTGSAQLSSIKKKYISLPNHLPLKLFKLSPLPIEKKILYLLAHN